MREFLFRGKHKYSDGKVGEWVYGSLSVMSGGGHAFIIDHSKDCIYEVDPSTVGQYAGLEDCTNVMRIYEGDILERFDGEKWDTVIITFRNGGFVATFDDDDLPLCDVNDEMKVVGNIHDNPNLLEG